MAAAEARAAWQRTANRYFVQEDAKRAPKLAYCSSSSSNTSSNGESPVGPDHSNSRTMPLNWNPASPNLPPDTTWWLQLQPNYACPKDYMHEKLSALDSKLDSSKEGQNLPNSNINKDPLMNQHSLSDLKEIAFGTCAKHELDTGLTSLKASSNNFQPKNKDDLCNLYKEKDLVDWKPLDLDFVKKSEQKLTDMEISWLENEKAGPWWRTTDRSELASLVAQKSLEPIQNCDLPQPRKINRVQTMIGDIESLEGDRFFPLVLDQKVDNELVAAVGYLQQELVHRDDYMGNLLAGEANNLHSNLDNLGSDRANSCSGGEGNDSSENRLLSGNEPSKAQLLEALRHSQTRAREAEKAAQQAYTEKEHIVKLFFRQASQLFAYKQWIQLLQLESLILQLKSKESQLTKLFPVLPWMPLKVKQLRKAGRRAVKIKGASKGHDISKYAVAFAVGLGLAGAGLLLGWTMGLLLPAF